jgi:hypothetical protein
MDLWDQKRAAGKGIFFVMQQGREIRVQHTQTIAGVVGQGRRAVGRFGISLPSFGYSYYS